MKKCSVCGARRKIIKSYRYRYGNQGKTRNHHIDDLGRRWVSDKCPLCCRKKNGVGRKSSKNKIVLACLESELLAKKFFEGLGFKVTLGTGIGPDLYCEMGKFIWTVEVKRPLLLRKNSWRLPQIEPGRKNDDLVAMVLPNGRVYIDSMEIHLSKCAKWGTRTITPIVKEFGLDKTL